MVIRKALLSLAAAGMVVGSTAAAAAPSVADVRAESPVADSESLSEWHLFVVAIIIIGLAGILWGGDDESPESP